MMATLRSSLKYVTCTIILKRYYNVLKIHTYFIYIYTGMQQKKTFTFFSQTSLTVSLNGKRYKETNILNKKQNTSTCYFSENGWPFCFSR